MSLLAFFFQPVTHQTTSEYGEDFILSLNDLNIMSSALQHDCERLPNKAVAYRISLL